ncbi:MAG: acetyl-CoA carboxylase biotin carboxyl carrier protein [Candidatus Rokubacteria bacterium]|nr:acetyl-CoA carboxylase biotin carboxyl carrier protein [Candidatus Rokubacteria bacterium]
MPIRRRARHGSEDAATLVRRLGKLLDELRLTEAEVTVGDMRVRVQRAAPAVAAAAAPAAAGLPDPVVIVERPGNMVTVEAPMVGTFYRASSPTAEPYVREGDVVKEGQIVCIIEAMKLMNEIEAKVAGRVAKILVENGQPVEYGQALFLIEPSR